MIIVTGSITAKEGNLEQALELSQQHVQRSRSEPGCISHTIYQDPEQPKRLFFYEQWQDMQALQIHFSVSESGEFVKSIAQLAESPPSLQIYQADEIQR